MADGRPVGAVLIGGRSTRMGVDKASLLWAGQPFADVVASALAPLCRRVVRVGGPPGGASLVDAAEDAGPLAGVVSALRALDGGRLLVASCDAPAVTADDLRALLEQQGAASYADGTGGRRWPLPCVLPASTLVVAEAQLSGGRRSLHGLLEAVGAASVPLGDDLQCRRLRGANTQEELDAMRAAFEPPTA
jgi:molybdopterin-guanine dinucleotide biosynthesis protein A